MTCLLRVNGNLALSRAMGDFVFKMNDKLSQVLEPTINNNSSQLALSQADQIVTCNPDIENAEVESDWDFVILACDGMSFCFVF